MRGLDLDTMLCAFSVRAHKIVSPINYESERNYRYCFIYCPKGFHELLSLYNKDSKSSFYMLHCGRTLSRLVLVKK
jgi:hypothetical protein